MPQHDDLRALVAQVSRLADYNARLVEMIEQFLLSLPVDPQPSAAAEPPADRADIAEEKMLLTADDLAELLGIPVRTLYQWRYMGKGPDALKAGKHLRYERTAVYRWIEEQAAKERLDPHRDTRTPLPSFKSQPAPGTMKRCPTKDVAPYRLSSFPGRGICGTCGADPILKKNGCLPSHWPSNAFSITRTR